MKENNFVWKILGAAGVAAVLVYFGTVLAGYLLNPLTTAVAYPYQSDETITVSGYLVRREEVLPSYDGLLFISREEGERVSAGGSVGVVYHSQEALEQARQLQQLRLQLEQLEYAQSVASGSQEALQLDSSIAQELVALKSAMASERYSAAEDAAAALETYVLKREYTYSGEGDVEEQLAGLADQIRALSASTRQSSTAVTVQEGGYYSALVDGYESVLTPDMLEELTPGQLRSVSPDASRTSNAGKIIYGNQWHYVALLSEADAGQLWEGAEVSLRFVSGLEKDVPMTVERISTAENGQQLVVLSADRYLSVTTLLRDQSAQIILQSYSGIRVPKTAVRVLDVTRENEAGEEEAVSLTGVYCRVGAAARFKPVDILYQGEDYYLVSPAPDRMGSLSETGRELRTLRNGDEVVVTAKDLYDGKVIG